MLQDQRGFYFFDGGYGLNNSSGILLYLIEIANKMR